MRYIFIFIFLVLSCATKKDVLIIQDTSSKIDYDIRYDEIKIMPDDILRVKISSNSPELAGLFSFDETYTTNTLESYQVNGYLVNSSGFINLPLLEPIKVEGLTLTEASTQIQNLLNDKGLLINSTVDIKIVNSYFTVLGEVNKPGRYNFLENNMNIFQALGLAGDLTINGKRNDVKILSKKNNGKIQVNNVDITSSEVLLSKNFQIFPGDIIIVNANNARVKNAGVIGNFGNLLSVLSFVLSSIILISNN